MNKVKSPLRAKLADALNSGHVLRKTTTFWLHYISTWWKILRSISFAVLHFLSISNDSMNFELQRTEFHCCVLFCCAFYCCVLLCSFFRLFFVCVCCVLFCLQTFFCQCCSCCVSLYCVCFVAFCCVVYCRVVSIVMAPCSLVLWAIRCVIFCYLVLCCIIVLKFGINTRCCFALCD